MFTNVATVSSDVDDPDDGNDRAESTVFVRSQDLPDTGGGRAGQIVMWALGFLLLGLCCWTLGTRDFRRRTN